MGLIVCEECGKHYDFRKDDFCPKCGAFNQPVKTWGMDAQGNVIRVDGVGERNHEASFAHSEVHREKRVRKIKGLDRGGAKGKRQAPPPRRPAQPMREKDTSMAGLKAVFWLAGILILSFLAYLFAAII